MFEHVLFNVMNRFYFTHGGGSQLNYTMNKSTMKNNIQLVQTTIFTRNNSTGYQGHVGFWSD